MGSGIMKWLVLFTFIVETTYAWSPRTCSATGDPHYSTFDNRRYDFMGVCRYVFAKDVNGVFTVLTKNQRCGARASCILWVTVRIGRVTINLYRGHHRRSVHGRQPGVFITNWSRGTQIRTNLGIWVRWDGGMNLYVTLNRRYGGRTRGLCGNNNGNPHDDFIDRWGQPRPRNIIHFAESWNVQRSCPAAPKPPNPCRNAGPVAIQAKTKCSFLRRPPFTKCHRRVNQVSAFIRACEYDVCACGKHPTSCMCEEISAFATACAIAKVPIRWKNLRQFAECSGPCGSFPCQNGGRCDAVGKSFRCTCQPGYTGKTCAELKCRKSRPLGMQSGRIRNLQIAASSSYHRFAPRKARLRSSSGSWWTTVRNHNQFLQVDFRYLATVTGISNQGAHDRNYFVRRYTLSYSNNGLKFQSYNSRGRVKVIPGTNNHNRINRHNLKPVIVTRFIRIHPKSWNGYIAMRVEFFGCFEDQPCANTPCRNEGKCRLNNFGELQCLCRAGYNGKRCEQTECRNPYRLGMQNGKILDIQIKASSVHGDSYLPHFGRLNKARGSGSWIPISNNLEEWLQVDFKRRATITAILTQGRNGANQFVRTYTLSYSKDGIDFIGYTKNGKLHTLKGNVNWNAVVTRRLSPVIVAQYIRLHPKTWHSYIAMRIDFLGCLKEWPCNSKPCRNGGTCLDYQSSYGCFCPERWTGRNCEKSTVCKWACASKPCLNGATCLDYKGGYRCACTAGWTGRNCHKNSRDPCAAKPCRNGGTCVPHQGYYVCACGKKWAGINCETKVEDCKKPRRYY